VCYWEHDDVTGCSEGEMRKQGKGLIKVEEGRNV
jgi:hypothetical protein